jgi:hypothetical protein
VAWPVVMQPKEKGGLGVLNLQLHNDALLLKSLDKFYNKREIPWVQLVWWKYYQGKVPHAAREVGSFWWKDILRLSNLFRGIARCTIGDGSTVLFWTIFGWIIFYQNNTQGCFRLQRTLEFQSKICCRQMNWKINFTSLYHKMHMKNWKLYNSS